MTPIRRTLVSISLVLLAIGCTPSAPEDQVSGDSATDEYTFTLPTSWSETDDLNAAAGFQASNEAEDSYLLVISEPKADFDMDLAGYADTAVGFLKQNANAKVVSGPKQITIGGRKAIQYEVSGTAEDVHVMYVHTSVEGEKGYHQVAAWTLESRYKETREGLLKAVEGFTLSTPK